MTVVLLFGALNTFVAQNHMHLLHSMQRVFRLRFRTCGDLETKVLWGWMHDQINDIQAAADETMALPLIELREVVALVHAAALLAHERARVHPA